jgi:asparagine synthase (glutamine-hydrolysing)
MCGIVGIFDYSAAPGDGREFVARAADAIAHRGPDDHGLYASDDGRVVLGHRRLSIVDLTSAGRQPMTNEDGTIWLTFNGEIYNHKLLRAGLLGQGHRFVSNTDTEAIIHLYEELGPQALEKLDGMFAFGLWDAGRGQLLLARDRLGKKPLYYTRLGDKLLFASELKAILTHPQLRRELDLQALNEYLTFCNVPAPRTLFANICKLPAGHRLLCDSRGHITVERYWSPLTRVWRRDIPEEEAIEHVRSLLQAAVRKRLMADVQVGCLLSGGLDSSSNVALMSGLQSRPLKTFTAGFAGFGPAQEFHDLPFAQLVAERFGCDHEVVTISARECKTYLPELAAHQDEPNADPACLPMHFVCKAAHAAGIKVVLVGEGSDEVFGGYDDMVAILRTTLPRWRRIMRLPVALRAVIHQLARVSSAPAGRIDLLRRAARGEPPYWGLDVAFWESEKRHLLSRGARSKMARSPAILVQEYCDELYAAQPGADGLQMMSYIELQNRLPESLLMRVDKISMAHSIEARAPFLDHELTAYALSLPSDLKIRGGATKRVLREAVRPFLPPEILQRGKQGFRVPLPDWLAGDLAAWATDVLGGSGLRKLDLFNWGEIDRMWVAHRTRRADHSFDLWCLLNLAAWYDHWIEGQHG